LDTKDLKKLNRKQLLELLLEQTKRVEELEELLRIAQDKMNERILAETEAGSIAEAALRLNGVFEAAQAAADQYVANVKRMTDLKMRIKNVNGEQDG